MTDTGQVPGEGQPENAGMVEQPGDPAAGSYAYLGPSDGAPEDDDLLLMPSSQGAWGDPQPAPPADPLAPAGYAVPDPEPVPVGHVPQQMGRAEYAPQEPSLPQSRLATYSQPEYQAEYQADPSVQGQVPYQAPPEYPAPDVAHMQMQPMHAAPPAQSAQPVPQQAEFAGAPEAYAPADVPVESPIPAAAAQSAPEPAREAVQSAPQEVAEAPAPEPLREAPAPAVQEAPAPAPEPGAHETGGRDSGSVDLGAVRVPTATPAPTPPPARRPLHMGPPMPDSTGGVVRSLADRGPSSTPPNPVRVRTQGPPTAGPEYLDIPREEADALPGPQLGAIPVLGADPWASLPPQSETPVAETAVAVAEPQVAVEPQVVAETAAPEAPAETVVSEGGPTFAPQPVQEPAPEPEPVREVAPEPEPVPEAVAEEVPEPAPVPEAVAEEVPAPEPTPEAQPEPEPVPVPETVAEEVPEPEAQSEPATAPVAEEPVAEPAPEPLPAPDAVVVDEAPAAEPAEPVEQPVEAEEKREPIALPGADAVAPAPAEPQSVQAEPEPEPQPEPAPEPAPVAEAEPAAEAEVAEAAEPVPAPAPEPVAAAVPVAAPTPVPDAEPEPPAVTDDASPPAPGYDDAEREAVLRVMRERRDIRNGFRSDPIPHEVLLRVLEAAHTAPSVGHSQPWDFVVIRSAETRQTMHELAQRQRDAFAKSLPKGRAKQFKELKIEAILDTPVNIVVTADPTRGGRHTLGRHTQPQMAPYSSALAVENLWLAARAEGLGVGWVSFFDEREMVRALGLPEHLDVVAYLCVGYVDEFPEEPELAQAGWSKRRPLSWVVHEETYGRRALPGEEPHDLLKETIAGIRPLDAKALGEAWERQKRMTKPAGALGMLEIISAQLSGLSRKCPPPIPEPAAVAVFAGDHGVHAQGVTHWPQEVTAQMVANFLGGGAVCNAFANQVGAEVCVIDVGVAGELPATPGLLPRKVRAGTADFTTGPALTREEVLAAIDVGIETARDLVAAGNKGLLTGEMGIANTTACAALISVYTDADPAEVTGRGTGINDEMHARKIDVVRRGIELHRPDPADPIGVLAAFGGLEQAALVGFLLGGASLRTPVILDGVSAGAAALVARAIAPEALAACIAGHRSAEPGHVAALNKLGLRPLVDLDLRLGEGTGALLALPVVQSAARAMHEVATFDSAGVTEK
ncbi:nicotinate-nucleotide--dimethylbenzimidazole phosphoribosyltransferase [Streptomyces sp. NBC_01725]|uniref:nicotinate-nucleotide--dimethylbenzimidazole phosphoribosyltransferase n=1 Tax=Streptomyces sp. NBC_01725 TaxID=2975923 RepID=UPI002E2E7D06|nr:nicotinate-nucleotide--dimethylbenzimidazole phosphoribosyltransferase [Streptomyces sp. NBC_01725]